MKQYDYISLSKMLIDTEVMNLISKIHEYKGKQELYLTTQPQTLEKLQAISIIQSIDSSNRLEGISTSDKRIKEIVEKKSEPKNRDESEIAGYRDVLTLVHENYSYIQLNRNDVLTLHNRLYSYLPDSHKGKYKQIDNQIIEEYLDGTTKVRFTPISAYETDQNMEQLYDALNDVVSKTEIDPLLYIPCFILDFLCIHPFKDGNGRMSRLLTLLLLYKSGYIVGKYISIEMIIERTKKTYYDSLENCTVGWHDNENSYLSFIKCMLGVFLMAYEKFDERYKIMLNKTMTPEERVYQVIDKSLSPLSKSDIVILCPEISKKTIERALNQLKSDNKIRMIGAGRNIMYIRFDRQGSIEKQITP